MDVSCTGTETATYQPGLTLRAKNVHTAVSGLLSPCTSPTTDITSGSYGQTFQATLSCDTLAAGLDATRVIHWSDGSTSAFAYHRAITNAAGQTTVTFAGTITAGRFRGATAVEQAIFVTPNVTQCLTSGGLTALGPGPVVLTVNHL
ncbi:hypothetical protein [Fodinicola feengrottensis]|uniref:hypothetical protein n=1 Tax=Fodinicola feengrottensis TaxID=435914 RepID=UPI0013D2A231|nr:hypothetical protein [Fodinicola feengrottensis]